MHPEKQHLFDKPENIKKVLYGLYASCALLLLLDFVIHRHTYHSWETLWGFYPLYGFVGCVVLVLIAKWMRTFLMRDEHYYDSDDAPEQAPAEHTGQNSIHNANHDKNGGGS